MSSQRTRQAGFTLVELLVVIGIIGVLVSLLVPAVNAAREAARRIQCTSQQRQFAMGLLNFEAANGALPVAGLTKETTQIPNGYHQRSGPQLSWIVLVLPYIEEQALFDEFVLDSVTEAPQQPESARTGVISIGFCPSGQARGRYFRRTLAGSLFSKTNYVGYVSPQNVADLRYLPGALGGFRPHPSRTTGQRLRRVKDGMTGTLAITEVRTLDHIRDHRGAWVLSWGASSVICPDVHHKFPGSYDFYVPDGDFEEAGLINTHRPNSIHFDELMTCGPNVAEQSLKARMPCTMMFSEVYMNGAPRSLHPGGVVATALDGHAGFLSNYIDAVPLGQLVSVYDGVPLDIMEHLR